MSVSLATKSAVCLGGVGCVASSAFGIRYFLNNRGSNISELIKSKNPEKRLLSSNSSEGAWKEAWKAYKEANKTSEKDVWSIEGWTKGSASQDEKAPTAFITACKDNGNKKVSNEQDILYTQVLSYCTRDTLMSDLVSENPKREALVKSGNESSDTHWVAAWGKYISDNPYVQGQQGKWTLNDWSSKHNQDNAVPVSFMIKCDTELKRKYHDTKGDDYKNVIAWCTKDISSQQAG